MCILRDMNRCLRGHVCFCGLAETLRQIGICLRLIGTGWFFFSTDIEAQIRDIQTKKKEIIAEAAKDKGVGLLESGYYDSELYDGGNNKSKYEGYVTSIAPNDDVDDDEDDGIPLGRGNRPAGYTAPAALLNDVAQVRFLVLVKLARVNDWCFLQPEKDYDPFADRRRPTVGEKEDEYRQKRRRLVISPERIDPFADGKFETIDFIEIPVDKCYVHKLS